jgi:hypothetical protein
MIQNLLIGILLFLLLRFLFIKYVTKWGEEMEEKESNNNNWPPPPTQYT